MDATAMVSRSCWSFSISILNPCPSWPSRFVTGTRQSRKNISGFQNTQFKLAELATEIEIGQAFVDKLLAAHVRGEEIVSEVSMAKWWTTDLQRKVSAECLQLFGGYGFMDEYPISRLYADSRAQKIYGGTNEIMKELIGRTL